MRIAKQSEIDDFMQRAVLDPEIAPYLSTTQYIAERTESKSDWDMVILINNAGTCLLIVRIDRTSENELAVSLYSKNAYAAGKSVVFIKDMARRYNSRAICAVVHSSNVKSSNFNKRILGEPWGREPAGAWNSLTGKWEDLLHFRKNLR